MESLGVQGRNLPLTPQQWKVVEGLVGGGGGEREPRVGMRSALPRCSECASTLPEQTAAWSSLSSFLHPDIESCHVYGCRKMTRGGPSNCRDLVFLGLICLVVSFASQSTISGRFLAVLVKFKVLHSLKGSSHESLRGTDEAV